jgi:hypothetical protein
VRQQIRSLRVPDLIGVLKYVVQKKSEIALSGNTTFRKHGKSRVRITISALHVFSLLVINIPFKISSV